MERSVHFDLVMNDTSTPQLSRHGYDFSRPSSRAVHYEQQAKSLIAAAEENIARIDSQIRDLMALRDRERGLITTLRLVIAPIRKLPSELLVQIFLHSLSLFRPSIKDVLKLCHVCALWKRLAYRTPGLWTMELPIEITNDTPRYIAARKIWLERSAPLSIPISVGFGADYNKKTSPSLVNLLLSVAPRWRTLRLYERMVSALVKLAPDSLRMLEAVELVYPDWRDEPRFYPISAFLNASLLRDVTLNVKHTGSFPMPWAQLTRLVLTDSDPQVCLDVLVQCADLVSANISTGTWKRLPPSSTVGITTFPRLENFRLHAQGNLSMPNRSPIAPFFRPLAFPSLKKLEIYFYEVDWTPVTATALEEFQRRSPNIETLSIQGRDIDSEELCSLLLHIPLLTELELELSMHCVDNYFLDELKYSDLNPVHLAPRLEVLNLSGVNDSFDEEVLEEMVASRWWTDEEFQALAAPPPVARWRRVHLWRGDDFDKFSRAFRDKIDQYKWEGLDIDIS
ncbi:hypothetical protein C8R44DRAFT_992086 [Mycena epipterygia]|nr:hypothetical protein C8R44DRAFT_992086 [Mycena epipterygia]